MPPPSRTIAHCAIRPGQKEDGFHARQPLEIRAAALRAEHEESVVECVTRRRAWREYRHAQHALHRPAGPRVHDVRIGDASGLERFLGAARHRERAILQSDRLCGLPPSHRIFNRHIPGFPSRRRAEAEHAAASGADQSGRDLAFPEQRGNAIDGVPLRDPPEVDFDAGLVEGDRARRWIEPHMTGTDVAASGREIAFGRQVAITPEEPPGLHQGADRHVKGTAGIMRVGQRRLEEVEQLRLDADGPPRRLAVQARDRALGTVVAHQPIDAVHFVERFVDDSWEALCVRPVSLDRVDARHRQARRLVAVERM